MRRNLPTEVLRNFIEVVECGSLMRASQKVNLSQSALSLQMKRLAELVQTPIFRRHRNGVLLTPAGETLATYARGMLELNDQAFDSVANGIPFGLVRLGVVQDFAALLVSGPIAHFREIFPDLNLRVKVGSGAELKSQFDAGLLDVMVGLGHSDEQGTLGSIQLSWLGHPALARQWEVPLAVMDAPCPFRDCMIMALERVGRPYRIALETPGIAALGAAINSGLGLTCRTSSLPFIDQSIEPGLDVPLPSLDVTLRQIGGAAAPIVRLTESIRVYLVNIISAGREARR